jgi:alpha-1,3-rhamnosyl/mannosyltransferase
VSGKIRVGVNALWMVPGVVGGTEVGTVSLLHSFAAAQAAGFHDDIEVVLYGLARLAAAHPHLLGQFEHHLVDLDGAQRPMRVLAETLWLPMRLRRDHIDVVHHAGGVVPVGGRWMGGARVALTVHDVQVLEHPAYFAPVKRRYLQWMLPRSVRAADLVLTPTEASGRTVADRLGVPDERMWLSRFSWPRGVLESPSDAERARVRATYRLPGPFFVYPAITYPHKNHALLLDAFAALVDQEGGAVDAITAPPVLVLTGAAAGEEDSVAARVERLGIGASVRRVGRIPRRDLGVLLAEATALTFPSQYEGFGLPALEAMIAGCPVIASDVGAVAEVVAGAGILVPTDDAEPWTTAMRRLLHDPALRQDLRAAGVQRAAAPTFSDEIASEQLAAAYRRAVAAR